MAIKDLKSLYDRHTRDDLGNTVAVPNGTGPLPSDGNYYTHEGGGNSPFGAPRGPKMDQLVRLLDERVKSGNSGITYKPSDPGLDMNGNDFGEGFSNPLTGNYIGRYSNPDTGATY
jgi:hypothetical protein